MRKQEVSLAFPNTPEMVSVAQCESGFHQFNSNGTPLHSKTNDYGILQINGSWIPIAKKMGLDIVNNAEDNITFGKYLLKKYGISQWNCS